MTEAEYLNRCPAGAWSEWIDGTMVVFEPPNLKHAEIALFLRAIIGRFVEDRSLGKVLSGAYQVRFLPLRCRRSPDVMFISNRRLTHATANYFDGAPDLLIEVVSTDSLSRDYGEKFIEYEKMGVREYWIVDPLSKNVEAFSRGRNGKFRLIAEKSERMASKALRGFFLKPSWLWKKRLPKVSAIFREIGPEA